MDRPHDHRFSSDLDRCSCGGEWVFWDEVGTYGCDVAGPEFAAQHPADSGGRYLNGRDRLPLRSLACRRCGEDTAQGSVYCPECLADRDEELRGGQHRYDLTRTAPTPFVPCTCGEDIHIDAWPEHRTPDSATVAARRFAEEWDRRYEEGADR